MRAAQAPSGIARRSLHEEVAEALRELVLSGELAPGSRLNEMELTARFGISRTPLREAIKVLARDGLVDLLPQRGARVASISLNEMEEMIEVVAALEGSAAELATRAMTPETLAAIEDAHAEMVAAFEAGDEALYLARNEAIHDLLMEASGNRTLLDLYRNFTGRIQRARYSAPKTPEQWAQAVADHEEMLVLLKAGRAEGLADLMRAHVRGKKVVIAAALAGERPGT